LSTSFCEYKRMQFSCDLKSIPEKCETPPWRLLSLAGSVTFALLPAAQHRISADILSFVNEGDSRHRETWQLDIMGRMQW
jgi:hypothetical protein